MYDLWTSSSPTGGNNTRLSEEHLDRFPTPKKPIEQQGEGAERGKQGNRFQGNARNTHDPMDTR